VLYSSRKRAFAYLGLAPETDESNQPGCAGISAGFAAPDN
jgi:hypothetical protein